jgi:hypothetical protein
VRASLDYGAGVKHQNLVGVRDSGKTVTALRLVAIHAAKAPRGARKEIVRDDEESAVLP